MQNNILIDIRDLKTYFFLKEGILKAVDGVSLTVYKGEALGLVGESGCGKSVTALSILRLVQDPPGKIVSGKILFEEMDILDIPIKQMRRIRGKQISMIFQDPMTSLNPVLTAGYQIVESFRLHQGFRKRDAWARTIEMLRIVGIPAPANRAHEYPHELSGGMRQRAMIAMALSCNPKLLIADEPTTALDVTIQAQVLELIRKIKEDFNTSVLLITHDLAVVAEMVDRVIVMYAGKIVEEAPVKDLFKIPLHPYTQGLLESVPRIDRVKRGKNIKEPLPEIPGLVPNLINLPKGCAFSPRCSKAMPICREQSPSMSLLEGHHSVSCWLFN